MTHKSNSSEIIQYCNCYLLRNHKIIKDDLWIRNGKILDPRIVFFDEKASADVQVDCHGAIISPGFIDVQCNGAFGVDFSDINTDLTARIPEVTRGLLPHGVTSLCPTVISLPKQHYAKIVPQIQKKPGGLDGTGILGVHLEGPFINPEKKGAHPAEHVLQPINGVSDVYDVYGNLDNAAIITVAPEIPGVMDIIRELTNKGIVVSLGHSTANLHTGEEAMLNGASFITHLFNAMLPFHHRDPHLVGLLASEKVPPGRTMYYGVIADGIHTDGSALRIAYRTHPKGLVLVTDAVPPMGLSVGLHHMGTQKVEITPDGRAIIAGTDTLCGCVASMNQCVQFFHKATGCTKVEALEVATLHPAELLGITDHKGTLDYGTDADFLLLDDDLTVQATYIGGEKVYNRNMMEANAMK